jgi:hypothetical protein
LILQIGQDGTDTNENKELRRLQFYGAGPKMAGYQTRKEEKPKNKTRGKKVNYEFDPVSVCFFQLAICSHCYISVDATYWDFPK